MSLGIIYKQPFGDDFRGISVRCGYGGGYIRLYMERSNNNSLYLFSDNGLLEESYLENDKETPVKTIHKLSKKNTPSLLRLNQEGKYLLHEAYRANGDYFFSFHDDDQDPWKNEAKKIHFQDIEKGLIITIGELFSVSG